MNGMGGIIMKGGVAVWPAPAEGGVVVLLVPGTLVPRNEHLTLVTVNWGFKVIQIQCV